MSLPRLGFRGVNVTIPHKEAALALATTASERATAIGAANTLTFGRDGGDPRRQHRRLRLHRQPAPAGTGLDAPPQARRWCSAPAVGPGDRRGAARPTARRRCGSPTAPAPRAEALRGAFRRPHRRRRLAGRRRRPPPAPRPSSTRPRSASAAARRARSTCAGAPARALVADLVYGAEPTPFIAEARRRGLPPSTASACCCTRRFPASRRWFGRRPEVDAELRAAVLAP